MRLKLRATTLGGLKEIVGWKMTDNEQAQGDTKATMSLEDILGTYYKERSSTHPSVASPLQEAITALNAYVEERVVQELREVSKKQPSPLHAIVGGSQGYREYIVNRIAQLEEKK